MKVKHLLFTLLVSLCTLPVNSQRVLNGNRETVPADVPQELRWWNLLNYSIEVTPDYEKKNISGNNNIRFVAINTGKVMQISLQEPMIITAVTWKKKPLLFKRKSEAIYLITFPRDLKSGNKEMISVAFKGHPKEALNPPFDDGWIWTKDEKGRPWMSIACEGSGASIWLPCKEVLYDEPDNGASISITIPDTLVAVANGRLEKKVIGKGGKVIYTWAVINPINNYNIIPYIGKYISWRRQYNGLKGLLDCDFWVLDYNKKKAETHFLQADTMLHAFEYWLGPYPFYEDSYKLVEAPMPGMEHQSAIAYGNGFRNGYGGTDRISGTGWGLKWDFILIHESGHEWFGNSITSCSMGEGWIHEGFTKYLETLYTDFVFGNAAGNEYTIGTWKRIKNDEPVIGSNTSDKYYKGSAMLHTIRQILGDTLFRGWLQLLNRELYHQTVSTDQVLELLNKYTKRDFTLTFTQYLTTTQIPTLEYSFHADKINYRWTNCVQGFDMPLKISLDNRTSLSITPTTKWQEMPVPKSGVRSLSVDKNYYVRTKQTTRRGRNSGNQ
jgi:aminopeptidase N